MARAALPLFTDSYFTYQITLAGSLWLFEYEWKDRLGGLYLSIYDSNGQSVIQGKRLSVGSSFSAFESGGPVGVFFPVGPQNESGDYTRADVRRGDVVLTYYNDRPEV